LNVEIYVPILAEGRLLGILSLGHKSSGEPYSPGDVTLLHTLAGQTAIALKNARLVEDLVRLNAEITQLNQELRDTNERLALLDKTKSDFISIASHELKTPLTHIKGYTDMLLEMGEGSSASVLSLGRIAGGLSKGIDRLTGVVEAMLDVSLIEQEAFSIHPVLTSVRYVVEQVIGGVEGALGERRLALKISGLEGLPQVLADETRLHQALRNIVINSIKFTPDEGEIEITGRMTEDGEAVELAIADTGIGIDPEHQELIFEKFYRVGDLNLHSTGATKFKGAGPGLGLPIARGIVEAHGGQIWVESVACDEQTCPGSTFYVRLPVKGPETQLVKGT
jgi:signal transduction histidine kinase